MNCKICNKRITSAGMYHDECLSEAIESAVSDVCDNLCKYHDMYDDQDRLESERCAVCSLVKLLQIVQ